MGRNLVGVIGTAIVAIYAIGSGRWVATDSLWYQSLPRLAWQPPGFVFGIVASLFVLFNCFAIVQWRQYRATGKWADYLHGERVYIVLSFVAKSLLAWQVFAGALAS